MKLNQAGIDIIKHYEGCKLESYPDLTGRWTIGWGTTGPDIVYGLTWTQEDCDKILRADLDHLEIRLSKIITNSAVNDNQFSACCSFAYNLGVGRFMNSTLLKLINHNALPEASQEFPKWDRGGGEVVQGLLNRRLAEQKLFNS